MSIQKIKGTADLFGPDCATFTRMEQTARRVFGRFGYAEVRVPVMEKTELFARSIGEETDVVQKEMYTFPDRKGRSLTLRPEATACLMRAYIENKVYAVEPVSKLFTFGPMFRYERPQKGRMRQFHQIDAELVGADTPESDAELLLMLWTYLRELAVPGLSFELNSLGCKDCRPGYRQALVDYFKGLGSDALCADCVRRTETNPLRVLDCKVPSCKAAVVDAPNITDHLCPDCAAHFAAVRGLLEDAGVAYTLNPRLVRGLDYYVGITFEVSSGDIGAQTAVAGGGRYDGLIRDLGGPDVAATGFAIGMERLALLLGPTEPAPLDFYVAVLDASAARPGLLAAQALREAGLTGDVGLEAKSLKSQMRTANKMGVRWCLLLGPDEIVKSEVQVKDMTSGEQATVPLDGVLAFLEDAK